MKKLFLILLAAAALSACSDDKAEDATQPEASIAIGIGTMEFFASGDVTTGENAVTVTSSDTWRLTGRKTWCTPSLTEGGSGDKVVFTAEANPTSESRSTTFTFICGSKAAKLVITQQSDDVIDCSQDRFDLGPQGELIRIRVESNLKLTAEISAAAKEWITLPPVTTRAMETLYLYYQVAPNDTYYDRSGEILLQGEGIEPRVITVSQAQTDNLEVEGDPYFKGELAAFDVRVTVWSNVPYTVDIPEDARGWLTLEPRSEWSGVWSSEELVFHVAAADAYRMAQVKLHAEVDALSQSLTFQQGEAPVLKFPDDNFREYLLGQKYIMAVGNGYMLTSEGKAATAFDLYTTLWDKKGCASLEGIENFTNLTTLDCRYGRLRALDISATKVADLSKCVPNALESLNAGPNVTIVNFAGAYSWSDGSLYDYTTKNSSYGYDYWAQSFVVTGENIETIDVSKNKLRLLDVSGCPALKTLKCKQSGMVLTTLYMAESQRGNVTITKDDNTQIVYK